MKGDPNPKDTQRHLLLLKLVMAVMIAVPLVLLILILSGVIKT